jgi:hypothetical protein
MGDGMGVVEVDNVKGKIGSNMTMIVGQRVNQHINRLTDSMDSEEVNSTSMTESLTD